MIAMSARDSLDGVLGLLLQVSAMSCAKAQRIGSANMSPEQSAQVAPRPTVNDNDSLPPAERSGPAILTLLKQAADVARRNEQRAQATAARLAEEVRTLEARNQLLEARLRELNERATRAEQWLLHIYDEIHNQFVEHSPPAAAGDAPARVVRLGD